MDATPCRPCWPSPSVPKQTTSACFCLCLAWWVCVLHKPKQGEPGPSGSSGWSHSALWGSGSAHVLCEGKKKHTMKEWNTLPRTESLQCPSPVLSSWPGRQERPRASEQPLLNTGSLPPRRDGSRDQEYRSRLLFLPYRGGRGYSIQNMYHFIPVLPQPRVPVSSRYKTYTALHYHRGTLLFKTIHRSAIFTTVRSVLAPASSRRLRKISPITVCIFLSFVGTFHLLSVYEFAF